MTQEDAKKKYEELFATEADKAAAFDKIAQRFYFANFATMSKSDIETLLFSVYLDRILDSSESNYDAYSDYTLSKVLGVPQSRISTLKVRKELQYPYPKFDWRESFAEEIKNAKYNEQDHYIRLIVQDVNVMNEVRHYIELHGWFDECSLNKKLLKIPLDCFAEVFLENDSGFSLSQEEKKELEALGKSEPEVKKFLADLTKDGVKSFLMSASKTLIPEVLKILPFGGFVRVAFNGLIGIIENM